MPRGLTTIVNDALGKGNPLGWASGTGTVGTTEAAPGCIGDPEKGAAAASAEATAATAVVGCKLGP